MSVYVDPLFRTPRSNRWPYAGACHMFADTIEELHETARKIGLKKQWFQSKVSWLPHYDLTFTKRCQAVDAGVILLSQSQAARKMRALYRETKKDSKRSPTCKSK